jgi:hypothetical protein
MILILTLATLSNAMDKSTSPPATDDNISVDATLKEDPVQKIQIGKFIAVFEDTTLAEIRNFLGAGSINHSGDAGSSQYWLCYSLKGQRVWFISDGEMGGSDHVLTQVHVISTGEKNVKNKSCPPLPPEVKPIQFDFGWIGTTKESLINSLGQPSGVDGNALIYFYHGKDADGDVLGYVEVKFKNNKIISIYASHVTSY